MCIVYVCRCASYFYGVILYTTRYHNRNVTSTSTQPEETSEITKQFNFMHIATGLHMMFPCTGNHPHAIDLIGLVWTCNPLCNPVCILISNNWVAGSIPFVIVNMEADVFSYHKRGEEQSFNHLSNLMTLWLR